MRNKVLSIVLVLMIAVASLGFVMDVSADGNFDFFDNVIFHGTSYHQGAVTMASTLAIDTVTPLVGASTALSRTTMYEIWATTVTTSGALSIANSHILIDEPASGVSALTLAAPTTGTHDGLKITITSADALAHTITATTIGFNATNADGDVCTLGGAVGDGLTIVAKGGEWWIVENRNCTLG